MFFLSRHFAFILQHFVLIVTNAFSHILICMFDEIIKKIDSNLAFKLNNLSLTQKITSSNLEGNQYPHEGIL